MSIAELRVLNCDCAAIDSAVIIEYPSLFSSRKQLILRSQREAQLTVALNASGAAEVKIFGRLLHVDCNGGSKALLILPAKDGLTFRTCTLEERYDMSGGATIKATQRTSGNMGCVYLYNRTQDRIPVILHDAILTKNTSFHLEPESYKKAYAQVDFAGRIKTCFRFPRGEATALVDANGESLVTISKDEMGQFHLQEVFEREAVNVFKEILQKKVKDYFGNHVNPSSGGGSTVCFEKHLAKLEKGQGSSEKNGPIVKLEPSPAQEQDLRNRMEKGEADLEKAFACANADMFVCIGDIMAGSCSILYTVLRILSGAGDGSSIETIGKECNKIVNAGCSLAEMSGKNPKYKWAYRVASLILHLPTLCRKLIAAHESGGERKSVASAAIAVLQFLVLGLVVIGDTILKLAEAGSGPAGFADFLVKSAPLALLVLDIQAFCIRAWGYSEEWRSPAATEGSRALALFQALLELGGLVCDCAICFTACPPLVIASFCIKTVNFGIDMFLNSKQADFTYALIENHTDSVIQVNAYDYRSWWANEYVAIGPGSSVYLYGAAKSSGDGPLQFQICVRSRGVWGKYYWVSCQQYLVTEDPIAIKQGSEMIETIITKMTKMLVAQERGRDDLNGRGEDLPALEHRLAETLRFVRQDPRPPPHGGFSCGTGLVRLFGFALLE